MNNSDKVMEITHTYVPGVAQDLARYLANNFSNFVFIEHPFKESLVLHKDTRSVMTRYEKGKITHINRSFKPSGPVIFYWIRDCIYTFLFAYRYKGKFDITICLDPFNAAVGILLKVLLKTKYLIYYTIDLTDKRFKNSLLNNIYVRIDKFVCKYADEVWNVSLAMSEFRKSFNYLKIIKNNKIVPIGIYKEDFSHIKGVKSKYPRIVYFGSLFRIMGVQIAIKSMPYILKKHPQAELLIIGKGEYIENLKQLVGKMRLNNRVLFEYYVKKEEMYKRLKTGYIGIAPYVNENASYKKYCDPTKVKEYFGAGLPVVISDFPIISDDIKKYQLGEVFKYNINDYVNAIDKLLSDTEYYNLCKLNINKYIENYTWEKIFSNSLSDYLKSK